MRIFLIFVAKEFIHILRDTRTTLILLVLPVVQVLLFGYALNSEVKNVKLAIFDQSKDIVSQRFTSDISNSSYFTLVRTPTSVAQIDTLFQQGAIDAALVVPPGLAGALAHPKQASLQLILDASSPNAARIIESYLSAIIFSALPQRPLQTIPHQVEVRTRMLFNPSLQSTYSFVPGVMGLVLIIICSIMTSVSIVREKEQGSMEVLLASPLNAIAMLLAKMTPYVVFSFINLCTILLMAHFMMGVPIQGSLALLLVFSALYIILSLSVGLLVSSGVSNQASAIMITGIGMMMPTLLLSGLIFPIQSMPVFLQWLSYAVPARWYISGLRQIMIQGVGWLDLWHEMTILFAMALLLTLLSLRNVKPRLQ